MKQVGISFHAIRRFAERVFNIPEALTENLSPAKVAHIHKLIKDSLIPHSHTLLNIGEGEYTCSDYGIKVIVKRYYVTTIKTLNPDDAWTKQFNGGRRRVERRENASKQMTKRSA